MTALRLKVAAQVLAVALVAALLALLGWKVTHQQGRNLVSDVSNDRKPAAPEFTLSRLDRDGELALESLRGKVVLVNFWATWCDPCKNEIPRLQAAWNRYEKRGVVFVGVDVNDFRGHARDLIRRYGVTYPNVFDGAGRALAKYGGLPLPKTFLIDRRGRVVDYHVGEMTEADIKRVLGAVRA